MNPKNGASMAALHILKTLGNPTLEAILKGIIGEVIDSPNGKLFRIDSSLYERNYLISMLPAEIKVSNQNVAAIPVSDELRDALKANVVNQLLLRWSRLYRKVSGTTNSPQNILLRTVLENEKGKNIENIRPWIQGYFSKGFLVPLIGRAHTSCNGAALPTYQDLVRSLTVIPGSLRPDEDANGAVVEIEAILGEAVAPDEEQTASQLQPQSSSDYQEQPWHRDSEGGVLADVRCRIQVLASEREAAVKLVPSLVMYLSLIDQKPDVLLSELLSVETIPYSPDDGDYWGMTEGDRHG